MKVISFKKSLIFSLSLIAFVNAAQADLSTSPQPQPKKKEVLGPNLVMTREQFVADMPKEMDKILPYIFNLLSMGELYTAGNKMSYNVIYTDTISDGNVLDIKPRFDKNQKLHFDFYLQKSLAKNPVYVLQTLCVLQTFLSTNIEIKSHQKATAWYWQTYHKDGVLNWAYHMPKVPKHYMMEVTHSALELLGVRATMTDLPLTWAEQKINADQGSAYAKLQIKTKQKNSLGNVISNYSSFRLFKDLTEDQKKDAFMEIAKANNIVIDPTLTSEDMAVKYFTDMGERLQNEVNALTEKAKAQYRNEKKYLDRADVKAKKDSMEDMALKLDDMVKANDREGAAKLLEAFLPLEIMEPMEKAMWQDWIEAIRHPDRENARLMFRGLDNQNDKPQIAYEGKKPVGYGFFSTMLGRNQGNYTRRLRSFVGMRYRFMNTSAQEKNPVETAPSIVGMMQQHSWTPQGSPLLSFSTSPRVAYSFSQRGMIAVKMDPRRFLPNMVSGYTNELELLVPLIVFPDEVVHMEEYPEPKKTGRAGVVYEDILARINEKLGHSYELDIEKDAKKMYLGAYKNFANAQGGLVGQCSRIFMK